MISGAVDGKMLLLQVNGKRVLQTFIHSHPTKAAVGTDGAPLPKPPAGRTDNTLIRLSINITVKMRKNII
jgi:hypothetical protein